MLGLVCLTAPPFNLYKNNHNNYLRVILLIGPPNGPSTGWENYFSISL
jgi:hypothetical protein